MRSGEWPRVSLQPLSVLTRLPRKPPLPPPYTVSCSRGLAGPRSGTWGLSGGGGTRPAAGPGEAPLQRQFRGQNAGEEPRAPWGGPRGGRPGEGLAKPPRCGLDPAGPGGDRRGGLLAAAWPARGLLRSAQPGARSGPPAGRAARRGGGALASHGHIRSALRARFALPGSRVTKCCVGVAPCKREKPPPRLPFRLLWARVLPC